MCGITGWVDWKDDATRRRSVLQAMVDTLEPRGPDDEGIWLSRHAALGHRRLAVIDPAGGAQPMHIHKNGSDYVIVYNGELYNTGELRRDLQDLGWSFCTHCDTEVLLAAYIEWGRESVSKLNGIFAFAVWNDTGRTLFMARDRLGVKPLFYAERGESLIFGSELKALLAHPGIQPEVDADGLAEIFLIGPARTPGQGVFRGVSELRPGWCLYYDGNGLRLDNYWSLTSRPHEDDLATTAERLRELLADTVRRQLVSDVPICVLLSGGLDSSTVAALASAALARQGLGPLRTFSVDYVDNDQYFKANRYQPDPDAPWVEKVSRELGTVHHNVILSQSALAEALRAAVFARDLPGMADIDSSLLLFAREIKKGATVGLSGEAADEILGGYPWFRQPGALSSKEFPWSRQISMRAALLAPEIRGTLRADDYVAARYGEALAEVPRLPGEDPYEEDMRALLYLNITRFLPTLLDRKDRMTMASGLEVRVPFCDHRLVEYVWNIPWAYKCAGGREKGILRLALRNVLPMDVLQRRKSPYPKTHHPAYLSATRAWLESVLAHPDSPLAPLLDLEYVRALLRANGEGVGLSWFGQLMGGAQLFAYLGQVDTWMRRYKVRIV